MKFIFMAIVSIFTINSQALDSRAFEEVLAAKSKWNALIQYQLQRKMNVKPGPMGFQILADAPDYKPIDDNCEIKVIPPSEKGELATADGKKKIPLFTVEIKGSNCPIQAYAAIDGVQAADGFDAKIVIQTQAISPEMRQLYDVIEQNVAMNFSAHMQASGPQDNQTVVMTFAVSGAENGTSQKYGIFTSSSVMDGLMKIVPSQQQGQMPEFTMNMNETIAYQISGQGFELKSMLTMLGLMGPTDEKYFYNGAAITKAEYEKYRSLMTLPFDEKPSQPNPTNPGSKLKCEVWIYDANIVPLSELKRSSADHSVIEKPNLLHDQRCSQMGVWNLQNVNDSLSIFLSFNQGYADLMISVNQQQQGGLSFLSDESSDNADQVQNYTFRMKCDPVPTCN